MAYDVIEITAGAGSPVATDKIGADHFQRFKAAWGVENVANDVSGANPLPCSVENQTPLGLALAGSSLPVVQASDHVPQCALSDIVDGNASNTDGTSTEVIAASGSASVGRALTTILLTNASATDLFVEILDGITVKLTISVPANAGAVVPLPVPIVGSGNSAWNYRPSIAATTTYCSMVGFDVGV